MLELHKEMVPGVIGPNLMDARWRGEGLIDAEDQTKIDRRLITSGNVSCICDAETISFRVPIDGAMTKQRGVVT